MSRDGLSAYDVEEALTHPTHPPRPTTGGRLIARRVHAHTVVNVVYEQGAAPLVISCWKARR